MLAKGDTAPDFALPDQSGTVVRLSELLAKGPAVLFFYPAAMTTGCTAEACNFRNLAVEFSQAGAQRLGISGDSVDRQKQFAEQNSFDYPLVSDADHAVAAAYGVKRRFGPPKRATFVIGADGVVVDTVSSELRMSKHADDALQIVLNIPK